MQPNKVNWNPRLAYHKNKTRKQKVKKCAELYYTGEAATQAEALWMTWLTNSKWNQYNASKAFKRKSMKKALDRLETQAVVRAAKKKEEVVSELTDREEKMIALEADIADLVQDKVKEVKEGAAELGDLSKAMNSLKAASKMANDIGARTDRLEGRNQADKKNEEDVAMDFLKEAVKSAQTGGIKQADVTDV
jgi:hypothetical protein